MTNLIEVGTLVQLGQWSQIWTVTNNNTIWDGPDNPTQILTLAPIDADGNETPRPGRMVEAGQVRVL